MLSCLGVGSCLFLYISFPIGGLFFSLLNCSLCTCFTDVSLGDDFFVVVVLLDVFSVVVGVWLVFSMVLISVCCFYGGCMVSVV